ncbi:MAG TPA: glycosyltransferase family 1 protein, partial [Ochrobactrum intermedium]|nr:glycosyltransferase family 1 protein [Brucella intermedia]
MKVPVQDVEVVAPNFKRRLSGVTSTIVQLIPLQRAKGLNIATMGPGLPDTLPHLGWGA